MSERYFSDLLIFHTVAGREATPQDFQDAMRAVAQAHVKYSQLDDTEGLAISRGLVCALVATAGRAAAVAARQASSKALPY